MNFLHEAFESFHFEDHEILYNDSQFEQNKKTITLLSLQQMPHEAPLEWLFVRLNALHASRLLRSIFLQLRKRIWQKICEKSLQYNRKYKLKSSKTNDEA